MNEDAEYIRRSLGLSPEAQLDIPEEPDGLLHLMLKARGLGAGPLWVQLVDSQANRVGDPKPIYPVTEDSSSMVFPDTTWSSIELGFSRSMGPTGLTLSSAHMLANKHDELSQAVWVLILPGHSLYAGDTFTLTDISLNVEQ